MKTILITLFSFIYFCNLQSSEGVFLLRNNLQRAQPGDYIVTSQSKNYTLMVIQSKKDETLNIEEITIPSARITDKSFSWKQWIEAGAPGNTCRVLYPIHLSTGVIQQVYSYTKKEWHSVPESQNFLSTLLSLQFNPVKQSDRKKIGPPPLPGTPDHRSIWQPPLIVDGKTLKGITFEAWTTQWPNDGSEVAGKLVEIYLPKESDKYPSYFPYWLQVGGLLGKAKVRIVDSGHINLKT